MHLSRNVAACAVLTALLLLGCGGSRQPAPEELTVEGTVTVRGNEPFAAYVLETESRNTYVLRFTDLEPPPTPATLRVTGRLFQDDWNGRPYAHIAVHEFEPVR